MQPDPPDSEIATRIFAAHERALEDARSRFRYELNALVQELSGDALTRTSRLHATASDGALAKKASGEASTLELDGEEVNDGFRIEVPDDDCNHEDALTIHSSRFTMLQNNRRSTDSYAERNSDSSVMVVGQQSTLQTELTELRPSAVQSQSLQQHSSAARKVSHTSIGSVFKKNTFSLRGEWQHHRDEEEKENAAEVLSLARKSRNFDNLASDTLNGKVKRRWVFKPRKFFTMSSLIASPGANWRLVWDLAGAVLIGYDTVAIPFGLAFQPKENAFSTTMDWLTMLFWSVDMVLTFFVGIIEQGVTVMSPARIAKRYLTTWFILDVLVVGGDWFNNVGNASSSGTDVSGLGRLVRSLRAIRILRLLRLLKLKRMLAELQDHINSEYTYLLLSLTKLLCSILLLNHGISCIWWWVGRNCYDSGGVKRCWVAKFGVIDRELGYQYTTSMHWTLTQFTPASMEVVPQNTLERTMAVCVLMFALVAFSSFVGSISTSMTALRNMNAETNKQFWLLRRYFKQSGVQKPVARRVLKYLEYIVELRQGKVQLTNIKILSMLSEQLREELTYELTKPNLQVNLFFKYSDTLFFMEPVCRRMCSHAMQTITYARGDMIFFVEDHAKHMYCLLKGHVEYSHITRTVSNAIPESRTADPGDMDRQCEEASQPLASQSAVMGNFGSLMSTRGKKEDILDPPVQVLEWVSEAASWSPWKHMGTLRALQESEMILTNIAKFIEECSKSIKTWTLASHYGNIFIDLVKDLDPTDVIRDEAFHIALEMLVVPKERQGGKSARWRFSQAPSISQTSVKKRAVPDVPLEPHPVSLRSTPSAVRT